MKILQIIPYFNPRRGGDVNAVYNISKSLMKRGHEVIIATTNFEFDMNYIESLKEIEVKMFKCLTTFGMILYTPSMKKWIKSEISNFDIVHIHTYRSYQNILVNKYTKKFNIPYVLQAHGSLISHLGKQLLKITYDCIWGIDILTNASKVIALTDIEFDQYKNLGVEEKKIEILPNGIDFSEFKNLPKKGEFRKKYYIDEKEKIILYLGRIHKIKGLEILLDAFADLTNKLKDVKLVIVGPDDGFLSNLKRQVESLKIQDKILIVGPLYGEDKIKTYVDADLYVLPSFYETFPITILEACACGKNVIVTKKCGIVNFVANFGHVVDFDRTELSNTMFKALKRKNYTENEGKKLKNIIRNEFDWNNIVTKLEKIYKECV